MKRRCNDSVFSHGCGQIFTGSRSNISLLFLSFQGNLRQFFLMQKSFLTKHHLFIRLTMFNFSFCGTSSSTFGGFGELSSIHKCLCCLSFCFAHLCSDHSFGSSLVFHTVKTLAISSLTRRINMILSIRSDAFALGSDFNITPHFIGLSIDDIIHELFAYATSVIGSLHRSSHRLQFFDGHC